MRKINLKAILIHAAMWMVYVLLEYLANIYHIRDGSEIEFLRSVMLSLPLIMIPTYFVVWIVVPRFLKTGKLLPSTISFLLVGLFVFYGRVWWMAVMNDMGFAVFEHIPVGKIFKNVIRDYSVIALAVCIYLLADWRNQEKLKMELIKAKAEAEMQLLKGQLHPHFLFNTLNNIYSLALIKSDLTADAILKLTELLDYLVYRVNSKSVLLSKEVQLINTYLDLESLRHDDKLVIQRKIEAGNLNIPIAPLIMLPFVENCFKHGGPGPDGIFLIQIAIVFKNNTLSFKINNTVRARAEQFYSQQGEGNAVENTSSSMQELSRPEDALRSGVGLDNIRRRLNLIYPDRYMLEIDNKDGQYSVNLTISYPDEV